MASSEEKFAADVLACVDEINVLLPGMAERYSDLTMATALAQHVGGALRVFLHQRICTPEQAHRILERMQQAAFPTLH